MTTQQALENLIREHQTMKAALQRIERWFGEFPDVPGQDGKLVPYGIALGSNGERDFMREIARESLK